jgi:hypothetical protein
VLLGMVYWFGDMISRNIIIDVDSKREINYGYNNQEVAILAFAVLLGAAAIAFFQMRGKDTTPWLIYGPMLLVKQLYDIRQSKR